MRSLEEIESHQIKLYKSSRPTSFTCVDQCFYMCYPAVCRILCFQSTFTNPVSIRVNKRFYKLHYDSCSQYFYALAQDEQHTVFILDGNFCIVDTICITCCQTMLNDITSDDCFIYVLCDEAIIRIDKLDMLQQEILLETSRDTCLIQICDDLLTSIITKDTNRLCFYNLCNGCEECCCLPICGCIIDFMICGNKLYILWRNEQECYCLSVFYFLDTPEECIEEECIEECHHGNCGCGNCQDLIIKTAKIEEALACLINAEGAKIQNAIKQGASICDLLCINDSVTLTLTQITQIEHLLYSKLLWCQKHEADCERCEIDDLLKDL